MPLTGTFTDINTIDAVVRLNAVEASDLFAGTVVTATTWTDFKANQNFTVGNANSIIIITVTGVATLGGTTAGSKSSRIVIDSAGTPIYRYVGGDYCSNAGDSVNIFAGSGMGIITGLSVGTHTVKTQTYTSAGNNVLYCRPSTQPNTEFFTTTVLELRPAGG